MPRDDRTDEGMDLGFWGPEMETGIEEIDTPNRLLAGYLAFIEESLASGKTGFGRPILQQLIDTLTEQYRTEEQIMAEHGYPLLEEHHNTHRAFIHQLERYLERYTDGEWICRHVAYDLKVWLTNHVKLQDGDFARHVDARRRHLFGH